MAFSKQHKLTKEDRVKGGKQRGVNMRARKDILALFHLLLNSKPNATNTKEIKDMFDKIDNKDICYYSMVIARMITNGYADDPMKNKIFIEFAKFMNELEQEQKIDDKELEKQLLIKKMDEAFYG